jgi:hypothetical protein
MKTRVVVVKLVMEVTGVGIYIGGLAHGVHHKDSGRDYLQFEINLASVRIHSQGEIHEDLELGSACTLTRAPGWLIRHVHAHTGATWLDGAEAGSQRPGCCVTTGLTPG